MIAASVVATVIAARSALEDAFDSNDKFSKRTAKGLGKVIGESEETVSALLETLSVTSSVGRRSGKTYFTLAD